MAVENTYILMFHFLLKLALPYQINKSGYKNVIKKRLPNKCHADATGQSFSLIGYDN